VSRNIGTTITTKSRLLCPDGCGMKRVVTIDPASYGENPLQDTRVTLSCGHERGELLPAKGISLEDLKHERGRKLFPLDQSAARFDRWRLT
jgi:hypothetical protein